MSRRRSKAAVIVRSVIVLGSTLALGCVAMVAIDHLQTDATGARDAQLKLVELRLDLAQIQQVPWGASPDEGDDPKAVHDELVGDQRHIDEVLAQLSRDPGLPERARISAPFGRTMRALWEIFDSVSHGKGDETGAPSSLA